MLNSNHFMFYLNDRSANSIWYSESKIQCIWKQFNVISNYLPFAIVTNYFTFAFVSERNVEKSRQIRNKNKVFSILHCKYITTIACRIMISESLKKEFYIKISSVTFYMNKWIICNDKRAPISLTDIQIHFA